MQAGNFTILYFEDFRECFRVYETIIFYLNDLHNSTEIKWDFPFEIGDGYGIVYNSKLDKILNMDNYETRWVMNPFNNQSKYVSS